MEESTSHFSEEEREQAVQCAVSENDIEKLRRISLLPGGFREARKQAWPYLLGVDILHHASSCQETAQPNDLLPDSDASPHMFDSFASLASEVSSQPETSHSESKFMKDVKNLPAHPDERQVQLDTDRSFVLYPFEEGRSHSRKLLQEDLHDVILGVLRKRSTLRYFQGYHDIMTVLFLTLPPELVLPCAEKLSLHRLRDSMGHGLEPLVGQLRVLKRLLRVINPEYAKLLEQNAPLPYYALSNLLTLFAHDVPTLPAIQHIYDWLFCREPVATIWLAAAVIIYKKDDVLALQKEGDEAMGLVHAVLSALPPLSEDEKSMKVSISSNTSDENDQRNFKVAEESTDSPTSTTNSTHENSFQNETPQPDPLTESWISESIQDQQSLESASDHSTDFDLSGNNESLLMPVAHSDLASSVDGDVVPNQTSHSKSSASQTKSNIYSSMERPSPSAPLPITSLLRQADELLARFPPSSPELRLTTTFGHQSALHTSIFMETGIFYTLKDDEAEACVSGDHVILPLSKEEQEEEEESSVLKESKAEVRRNERRRLVIRKGLMIRRQTMIAGAVLLLGVAVAFYAGKHSGRSFGNRRGGESVGWVAAWIGAILGAGDKLGILL